MEQLKLTTFYSYWPHNFKKGYKMVDICPICQRMNEINSNPKKRTIYYEDEK